MLTRIPLAPGNRMLRIGVGLHCADPSSRPRWFLRIDLWWFGYRVTRTDS